MHYIFTPQVSHAELERQVKLARQELRQVEVSTIVLKEDINAFRNEVSALAAWNDCLRTLTSNHVKE